MERSRNCTVGHASVTSMGKFLDVVYGDDFHRIFDIDWKLSNPAQVPVIGEAHPMTFVPTCFDTTTAISTLGPGWIMPLKHADYLTYGGVEYLVGFDGRRVSGRCSSPTPPLHS